LEREDLVGSVTDDCLIHRTENRDRLPLRNIFFELFFGAWNILNVVEHSCGTFASLWNIYKYEINK
jgi:hypothetical protein